MEYLLIMGLTLLSYWSIIKISNKKRMIFLSKNKYRQSSIYEMVKDVVPKQRFDKPKVITQSQRHIQKNMLRVVIAEGKAYWILNNVFYTPRDLFMYATIAVTLYTGAQYFQAALKKD